jgi:hypothetical protein
MMFAMNYAGIAAFGLLTFQTALAHDLLLHYQGRMIKKIELVRFMHFNKLMELEGGPEAN